MFTKYHDLTIKTADGDILAHRVILGVHPYFKDKLDNVVLDLAHYSKASIKLWIEKMYSAIFKADNECSGSPEYPYGHCDSCVRKNGIIKLPNLEYSKFDWSDFSAREKADYVSLIAEIGTDYVGDYIPRLDDGLVFHFDSITLEKLVRNGMWRLFTLNDLIRAVLPLHSDKISMDVILFTYQYEENYDIIKFYPNESDLSNIIIKYDEERDSNRLDWLIKFRTIIIPDDRPDVFANLLKVIPAKYYIRESVGPNLKIRGVEFIGDIFPEQLKVSELKKMSYDAEFFTNLLKDNCQKYHDQNKLAKMYAIINAGDANLSVAIVAAVTGYVGVKWHDKVWNGASKEENDYYSELRQKKITNKILHDRIIAHLAKYNAGEPSADQTDGCWMWY